MSNQLKTFVGHSFIDDDKTVVGEFLKYFDQIKEMNIGFSWEHAEKKEPSELADKVIRLMEDKNLFIGICTKKELTIDPSKLIEAGFKKKKFKAEKTAFTLKTSDWITQEIGFAIGRKNMKLILLLEKGVQQPGGLQGNLEYIPFERDSVSNSFGRIIEMISSLRPKAPAATVEQSEMRSVPVEQVNAQDQQTEDQQTLDQVEPNKNWEIIDYRLALYSAIDDGNEEREKNIREAFLTSEFGQNEDNIGMWEAREEFYRITANKGGRLAKLETLAKRYPDNVGVQRILALAYLKYDDHDRAATQFITTAKNAKTKLDELELYGKAAISYTHSSQKQKADPIIATMKELIPKIENGEVEFIRILCEIAEINADEDLYFGLVERLLQIEPDNTDSRFRLAFKYSQTNKDDLSLFHYLKIPEKGRGAGAWNNLGVQFNNCDLPYKSISAYRKAEELEETLAMSNLANRFIKSGFLNEADELCKRAVKYDDCHKNVYESISKIKNMPDQEEEKEKPILNGIKPLSEFYRDYGYASLQADQSDLDGHWQGPLCNLTLSIKNNCLVASG